MPIRFRCAYCNQLLGIARRKAGTVVRCPKCAGQVVVPNPEGAAASQRPRLRPEVPAALFERSDFDNLFEPMGGAPAKVERPALVAPAPIPAPVPEPEPIPFPDVAPQPPIPPVPWRGDAGNQFSIDPEPPPVHRALEPPPLPPLPPPGLLLSPLLTTILSVAVILGFALSFAAGLVVGCFWLCEP